MIKCINFSHPDFTKLQEKFGKKYAIAATLKNNGEIPSIDVAEKLLNTKLSDAAFEKQKQLKEAITTQQKIVDDLFAQADPANVSDVNDAINFLTSSNFVLDDAETFVRNFDSNEVQLVRETLKLKNLYDIQSNIQDIEDEYYEQNNDETKDNFGNLKKIRQVIDELGFIASPSKLRLDLSSFAYGASNSDDFIKSIQANKDYSNRYPITLENQVAYKKLWNLLNEYIPVNYARIKNNYGFNDSGAYDNLTIEKFVFSKDNPTFSTKDKNGKNRDRSFFVKQSPMLKTLKDNNIEHYLFENFVDNFNYKGTTNTQKIRNVGTEQDYKEMYSALLSQGYVDLGAIADKSTRVFVKLANTNQFKTLEQSKQTLSDYMSNFGLKKDVINTTIYNTLAFVDRLANEKVLRYKDVKTKDEYYNRALNGVFTWLNTQKLITGFISDFDDTYSFTKRLSGANAPGLPLDAKEIEKKTGRSKLRLLVVKDKILNVVVNGKVLRINSTDSAMYMNAKSYNDIFITGSNGIVSGFPGKPVIYENNPTSVFYGKMATFNASDLSGEDIISNKYTVNGQPLFDGFIFESAVKRNTQFKNGQKESVPALDYNSFVNGIDNVDSYIKELDYSTIRIQDTEANRSHETAPYPSQLAEIFLSSSRTVEKLVNASNMIKADKFNEVFSEPFVLWKRFFNPTDSTEYMDEIVKNIPDSVYNPSFKPLVNRLFFTKFRQENLVRKTPGDNIVLEPHIFVDDNLEFPHSYLQQNGEVTEIASVYVHPSFGEVGQEIIITRIPTDKLSSSLVARIVGHLPDAHGNTIVVPPHFMATSGIDFDKDTVAVWKSNYQKAIKNAKYLNYQIYNNQNLSQEKKLKLFEITNPNSKNSLNYIGFLSKEDALMEIAFKEAIKDIMSNDYNRLTDNTGASSVYDIFGTEKSKSNVNTFWTPNVLTKTSATIDTVKSAIGIQARLTKNMTLLSDVGFEIPVKILGQQYSKFLQNDAKIGNYSLEQINSALISAAVDSVKDPDPLISINYNEVTGNVITTLLRYGVDPKVVKSIMFNSEVQDYVNYIRGNYPNNLAEGTKFKSELTEKYSNIWYSVLKNNGFEIRFAEKLKDWQVKDIEIQSKNQKYSPELEAFILTKAVSDSLKPFNDLMSLTTNSVNDVDNIGTIEVAELKSNDLSLYNANKYGLVSNFLVFNKYVKSAVGVVIPFNNVNIEAIAPIHFLQSLIKSMPNNYRLDQDAVTTISNSMSSFIENKYINRDFVESKSDLEIYINKTIKPLSQAIQNEYQRLSANRDLSISDIVNKIKKSFIDKTSKLSTKEKYALTYDLLNQQFKESKDKTIYLDSGIVNIAYALGDINTLREYSKEIYRLTNSEINSQNRLEENLFNSAERFYNRNECE